MPCYRPITAFHTTGGSITFNRSQSFGIELQLPCGRCIGCRLEKAKEWALRCSHEASLNKSGLNNSFLTLTYAPEHLPQDGNLKHEDFQIFIKRLRHKTKKKLRYFMCGEYGDETNRPHYHVILFGHTFVDQKLVNVRKGNRVYTSQLLDKAWRKGGCEISGVTFKSAGYVARYILKKQQGDPAETFKRYVIINPETGEMKSRKLEYTQMSLKPGIGKKWYEQNYSDCFPHDYCVLPDGRQTSVPGYYRDLLRKSDPALWDKLRNDRIEKSKSNPNNTPARLVVRESCKRAQTQKLSRDFL